MAPGKQSGMDPTQFPCRADSLKPAFRGRSSIGRAPALQAGGRGFDSHRLHHSFPLFGFHAITLPRL